MASLCTITIPGLLVALLTVVPASAEVPLDLCRVANTSSTVSVLLKGVGQSTSEGLIVPGSSCPVYTLGRIKIPAAVQVRVTSFSSDQLKVRFSEIQPSISSPLLRVVVRGDIECKANLTFQLTDDRKEVVAGNGYGSLGFWKCRMDNGRIEALEVSGRQRRSWPIARSATAAPPALGSAAE
jgi:hypothetical protein